MPAAVIPIAMMAASAAGSYAASRARGREAQAAANQQQDQLRLQAERDAQSNPERTQKDMIRSLLLSNPPDDLQLSHPRATMPTMTGGMKLSQLQSPGSRVLGQTMERNALLQGMKGYQPNFQVTPQPQASGLDKVLGVVGAIGTGAGNAYYGGQNLQALFQNPQAQRAFNPQLGNPEDYT